MLKKIYQILVEILQLLREIRKVRLEVPEAKPTNILPARQKAKGITYEKKWHKVVPDGYKAMSTLAALIQRPYAEVSSLADKIGIERYYIQAKGGKRRVLSLSDCERIIKHLNK